MNNKQYVGTKAELNSFVRYNDVGPIDGIRLIVDDDNEYQAGNMNGYVLDVECPYGTQQMANNIFADIRGYTYKGFRASNAQLAPTAELGDGITVGGIYSVLAYRSIEFGPGHMAEIAAPGDSELEHEYPYISSTQREFNKQARQWSWIKKTTEEIQLGIEDIDGRLSTITQTIDNISLKVRGKLGEMAYIEISSGEDGDGKLDLTGVREAFANDNSSVTIGAGTIKFTSGTLLIDSENLKLNKDGTLTITNNAEIRNSVIIEDNPDDGSRMEIRNGGITYYKDSYYSTPTAYFGISTYQGNYGLRLSALDENNNRGNIDLYYGNGYIFLGGDEDRGITINAQRGATLKVRCELNMEGNAITNQSDERLKYNIKESGIDALSILNNVRLYEFEWIETGKHEKLGFVAQQLEAESEPEFYRSGNVYRVNSIGMIPYLVKAIQELLPRVEKLEGKHSASYIHKKWEPNRYTMDEKIKFTKELTDARNRKTGV